MLARFMEALQGGLTGIVEYRSEAEIQKLLIADSREEGRKEGREEGRKEGREEGRKEGREEIVANLVKSKILTPTQIASGTGVPLDVVQRIEEKLREKELDAAL